MSYHDNESADKALKNNKSEATDTHRQSRRRLLTMLGVAVAGAYVAPTLFSVGQAQAWHRGSSYSRPSYSRPSYSRPSYSRPSYSRPSHYEYRRRERLREYTDDPLIILEEAILGPQRR